MRPCATLVLFLFLVIAINDVLAAADDLELLILHNNDMHSRFEETSRSSGTCKNKTSRNGRLNRSAPQQGCVGGFARTAHEVRRYRKLAEEGKGRPVLFLNAGDTYTGTAWFSVHKWKICADFLNILKPDVMSLGNHEFDNGPGGLAPLLNNLEFPTVVANLDLSQEPNLQPRLPKSVVLNVTGRQVGVVGYLTPETKIISQSGNVIFTDMVEALKEETERLDKAGVKIIIALGHGGYEADKEIAEKVPLVDVVVGGHTNTFLWNGNQPDLEVPEDVYPKVVTQSSGKKVPVVQAYAYTKYLGRLNVTFNTAGEVINFDGQPELLDTNVPQDQDVIQLLEGYRQAVEDLDRTVVGKSRVTLDSTSNKCRETECNFGNLIADALVFSMAVLNTGPGWTDVPIGLVNGGGIRNTIEPQASGGNITRGELLGVLPFENEIVTLKLNGSDLMRTLEIGDRSNGETSKGEFLQVSGLHVVYNQSKPAGSRVVEVKARCGHCTIPTYEPVIPDQIYHLITLSFLVNGGDGHYVLNENGFDKKIQDMNDIDTVQWYISLKSPVYAEEQGRIMFIKDKPLDDDDDGNSSANKISIRYSALVAFVVIVILI